MCTRNILEKIHIKLWEEIVEGFKGNVKRMYGKNLEMS